MKKDLVELHSSRAESKIIIYFIFSIIFLLFLCFLLYGLLFHDFSNYFMIFGLCFMLILYIGMYVYSYLGYLDLKNNVVILKKPYLKKVWKIKLEDITNIEKERLFVTKGKHIKINTYNKDKTDTNSYYILASRLSSLFGSDDAEYLWKAVLKRKKELKDINGN